MNVKEMMKAYKQMVLARMFETKVAEMYTKGKIGGFCHLYTGEEAVAVGALWNLRKDDYVVGSYRDHAYFLLRGGDPGVCLAEMYGHSNGCCKGRGGSMHLFDKEINFLGGYAIVAGECPIAVGLGQAIKYKGGDQVVVCFFGDGATNQGVFHEAMNMASLWSLPIIFICENNLYGISTGVEKASSVSDIHLKAKAYDMPSQEVDGMDFFKMLSVSDRAIARARSGKGPSFIEAICYRYRGHSMADAASYRSKEEVEHWKQRDSLDKMKKIIKHDFEVDDSEFEKVEDEVREILKEAVAFAEAGQELPFDRVYEDLYVE